jgi:hypothetical protein
VIDGIIVAASMVLLDAARHREGAPPLPWWLLGAGIGVTGSAALFGRSCCKSLPESGFFPGAARRMTPAARA